MAQELIRSLQGLQGSLINDALATLGNLITTVSELSEGARNEVLNALAEVFGRASGEINRILEQAGVNGISTQNCTKYLNELDNTYNKYLQNGMNCISEEAGGTLRQVSDSLMKINMIVTNITILPVKLSKCLITLRPISCVRGLIGDMTNMLGSIAAIVLDTVKVATDSVENLNFISCLTQLIGNATEAASRIVADTQNCVAILQPDVQ